MSWVISQLGVILNDSYVQDYEAELMKISSDIDYFDMQEKNITIRLDREYTDENELITTEYDEKLKNVEANTQEYVNLSTEKLEKLRTLSNKHTAEINKIQQDTDRKINPLEQRKERVETLIKNARAQMESWENATSSNVEKECSYFSN